MFKALALCGSALALIAAIWIVGARVVRRARLTASPIASVAPGAPAELIPIDGAPVRGDGHGKVVVVEFSDFQCPACAHAESTVRTMQQQLGRDVALVWKNLPLDELHPLARLAAEAALAAGAQGQFWPMHDRLFANQRSLDRASLERFARELRLDVARFRQALDSGAYRARVDADVALADRLGVSGTPTFFVDGQRIANWPAELIPTAKRQLARTDLAGGGDVAPAPPAQEPPIPVCTPAAHAEQAPGSCT
jgi:protein-disulfide isomerase